MTLQRPHPQTTAERPRIKRPVVSDEDGTREGGLIFPIVFILGFVAASVAHPAALSSFWVWFILLMLSTAVAVGTQKGVARLNGHVAEHEDDMRGPI